MSYIILWDHISDRKDRSLVSLFASLLGCKLLDGKESDNWHSFMQSTHIYEVLTLSCTDLSK